jgi:hypothetical protein
MLCLLRNNGNWSEADKAEKLGFGSPESMYRQLEIWELSGLGPQKGVEPPPKAPVEALTSADERKAWQGGGKAKELPPAADAAPEKPRAWVYVQPCAARWRPCALARGTRIRFDAERSETILVFVKTKQHWCTFPKHKTI